MSSGAITNKAARKPIARKSHVCCWCGGAIVVGEQYSVWPWNDGGRVVSVKCHLDCAAAWGREDDCEFASGDCDRGKTHKETWEWGERHGWCSVCDREFELPRIRRLYRPQDGDYVPSVCGECSAGADEWSEV